METRIRPARPGDLEVVVAMRCDLWPEETREEHAAFARAILEGRPPSTQPLVMFVAERDGGELAGFVDVGLRSHANGCDGEHVIGFVEGWYVAPEARRRGVGRALVAAAEAWAREQGCTEMASDTGVDNEVSERAHVAAGFAVVERCVNFRKAIGG
jgi:aminoglycoside 6'-N-acetyltransferase I